MTPEEIAAEEAKVLEEAKANEAIAAEEQKEKEQQASKSTSVVKLLEQRNAARAEAAANTEKAQLADKLIKKNAELEELVANQAIESEAKVERGDFYSKNPYAKEFEADIDALKVSKGLSYDDAAKLVIADKKPELLLEEQVRNKMSGGAPLTGVPKENAFDGKNPGSTEDFSKMSADDFIKWGNEQALKERTASGLLR